MDIVSNQLAEPIRVRFWAPSEGHWVSVPMPLKSPEDKRDRSNVTYYTTTTGRRLDGAVLLSCQPWSCLLSNSHVHTDDYRTPYTDSNPFVATLCSSCVDHTMKVISESHQAKFCVDLDSTGLAVYLE